MNDNDFNDDLDDIGEDQAIAQGEVLSAARSCSAILIIAVLIALVLCVAIGLTIAF